MAVRRRGRRATVLLTDALGLVAALGFLLLAVGPHLLGYRTAVMLTGSMRPTAAPGDLLVVRSEPVAALARGQVLTFTAPVAGSPTVTHRVVDAVTEDGGVEVVTRGDANPAADPWRLRLTGRRAWYVVGVVPGGGRPLALLHRSGVRLLCVLVLPALLCLELLRMLWRRPAAAAGA